jgi:integrase
LVFSGQTEHASLKASAREYKGSFALIQQGVNLCEAQRLLGHKSHAMTQWYPHLAPENLMNAVLKLDKTEAGKNPVTNKSHSQKEGVSQTD